MNNFNEHFKNEVAMMMNVTNELLERVEDLATDIDNLEDIERAEELKEKIQNLQVSVEDIETGRHCLIRDNDYSKEDFDGVVNAILEEASGFQFQIEEF